MQFKQTCPTGKLPQKKKNTYTTKATLQHKLWMDMVRGSQDCANHSIILNNDEPRLTFVSDNKRHVIRNRRSSR